MLKRDFSTPIDKPVTQLERVIVGTFGTIFGMLIGVILAMVYASNSIFFEFLWFMGSALACGLVSALEPRLVIGLLTSLGLGGLFS